MVNDMKKVSVFMVFFVLVLMLTACKDKTKTLIIYQNKSEIHDALNEYATAWGERADVYVDVNTCGGDTCSYAAEIGLELELETPPDIFVVEGMGGYNLYEDYILDISGEQWTNDTELEFMVEGVTYGFPVAIEGWGMGYNAEILESAGVDPNDLITFEAYETAFELIDTYYTTNELDYTVVSMVTSSGMTWVTGLHNFNAYLSSGLDYDDRSVIDDLNNGIVDDDRLSDLTDWVELLYQYTEETLLVTGDYSAQVGKFSSGEAAFIHQGNWIDGDLVGVANFEMGYAPHAAMGGINDSIFVGAPSFYVINKKSKNIEEAKLFLNDLAATQEGHEYMVNEANMVPAFNSVTLVPSSPLSAAVLEWSQSGKIYAWWQNDMPSEFGMGVLGPIYGLYAEGLITKSEFIVLIKSEIEDLE